MLFRSNLFAIWPSCITDPLLQIDPLWFLINKLMPAYPPEGGACDIPLLQAEDSTNHSYFAVLLSESVPDSGTLITLIFRID